SRRLALSHAMLLARASLGLVRRWSSLGVKLYLVFMSIYGMYRDHTHALESFNYALRICVSVYGGGSGIGGGKSTPLEGHVWMELGSMWYLLGEFERALEAFSKAHKIATNTLGNSHKITALYLTKIGHVHRTKMNGEEALGCYERARFIYEAVDGPSSIDVSFIHFYRAEAKILTGEQQGAIVAARRSLDIRVKLLGDTHPLTLASYTQMAKVAEKSSNTAMTIKLYEHLLKKLRVVTGEISPESIEEGDEPARKPTKIFTAGEILQCQNQIKKVVRTIVGISLKELPLQHQGVIRRVKAKYLGEGGKDKHGGSRSGKMSFSGVLGSSATCVSRIYDKAGVRRILNLLYKADNPSKVVESIVERSMRLDGHGDNDLVCLIQCVDVKESELQEVEEGEQEDQYTRAERMVQRITLQNQVGGGAMSPDGL
ncbi:hypothetical protein ADUPG1_011312, partial [Aduncisulcus paluster]